MVQQDSMMLEVSGLKKSFGGDVVLDGVDMTVSRGEVVVILGSSGCGKSTLLRCINGLEYFDKGSIRIDGEEIATSRLLPSRCRSARRRTRERKPNSFFGASDFGKSGKPIRGSFPADRSSASRLSVRFA